MHATKAPTPMSSEVSLASMPRWANQGQGASIVVVAALESKRYATAVSNWNNGTPESLDLTTSYTDYDCNCDPIGIKNQGV